jgi:cbb3-type cytochrome oxidase subunit 3
MNRPIPGLARRWQRGIATIELAVILPVLLAFLGFSFFYGRVFWHYTAAHKAAHDAARYFATVPQTEFKSSTRTGFAVAVAQSIALQETADLNPGPDPPNIGVICDGLPCAGFAPPNLITVGVQLNMYDTIFSQITGDALGAGPLPVTARVTMKYVGK